MIGNVNVLLQHGCANGGPDWTTEFSWVMADDFTENMELCQEKGMFGPLRRIELLTK